MSTSRIIDFLVFWDLSIEEFRGMVYGGTVGSFEKDWKETTLANIRTLLQ